MISFSLLPQLRFPFSFFRICTVYSLTLPENVFIASFFSLSSLLRYARLFLSELIEQEKSIDSSRR